jgi:hypothetical protein
MVEGENKPKPSGPVMRARNCRLSCIECPFRFLAAIGNPNTLFVSCTGWSRSTTALAGSTSSPVLFKIISIPYLEYHYTVLATFVNRDRKRRTGDINILCRCESEMYKMFSRNCWCERHSVYKTTINKKRQEINKRVWKV